MSESRVATRYALSLFELAQEQNSLEQIEQDVQSLLKLIKQNRDLELLLMSPVVSASKKTNVFQKAFKGELQPLMLTFVQVVIRKRREGALRQIFEQFIALDCERKGILTATLTTAVPVSEKIENDIKRFLENKTHKSVELQTKVNANIMGGFVLHYKDKLIDTSVASKLKDLRKHLVHNN